MTIWGLDDSLRAWPSEEALSLSNFVRAAMSQKPMRGLLGVVYGCSIGSKVEIVSKSITDSYVSDPTIDLGIFSTL